MKAKDIMTKNPEVCGPGANVREVARLMMGADCGEIPVVDDFKHLLGVITDRDICCRVVAGGLNPDSTEVRQCMSIPAVFVSTTTSLDECCRLMEENQIRRLPVVDDSGACCGMIAQADIATRYAGPEIAEIVRQVSAPCEEASRVESH